MKIRYFLNELAVATKTFWRRTADRKWPFDRNHDRKWAATRCVPDGPASAFRQEAEVRFAGGYVREVPTAEVASCLALVIGKSDMYH